MEAYDFIIDAVKKAGSLALRAREETFEVSSKGGDPRDVVTSVDLDINNLLVEAIRAAYPTDGIYSEESGGVDTHERLWVIDPIDGSSNFARNIPHFAVCLGLLERGVPTAGAVYNPVTDELFSFKKGMGAFLNGKPIHVSNITEVEKATIFLHAGRDPKRWDWGGAAYRTLLEKGGKTRNFGSSGLDMCFIAAGRIEANVYGVLNPLDIASAIGILREAGGLVLNEAGEDATFSAQAQKITGVNNATLSASLSALI